MVGRVFFDDVIRRYGLALRWVLARQTLTLWSAVGTLVLTAGVDVQDDRLECDVWGWAEGFSSWLVDHVVIPGSPRDREPWDDLAKLLARDWPRQGKRVTVLEAATPLANDDPECAAIVLAQMEREGALITKHPLLIQKALADKLSDKVQVIIAPPPS